MSEDLENINFSQPPAEAASDSKPKRGRPPVPRPVGSTSSQAADKPAENKVVKLLDKNPVGMTLPEMAGGPRQLKRIRTLRPQLAEAIRAGLIMPVSQRAGHTVYRLVRHIANR
ncbi:hypothetical protein KBI23_18960 [bacterium]|nr:hypothetical protein [bacterium]MBP9806968.1 hypothetical protein [bacterium]